jgi:hypothetical protein
VVHTFYLNASSVSGPGFGGHFTCGWVVLRDDMALQCHKFLLLHNYDNASRPAAASCSYHTDIYNTIE